MGSGEWLGLDIVSWGAIIAGCALMAWSLFLDWRLEHWAPGVYHHHSGGALLFAAAFWIGGLLRHPGSQATTPTVTILGVAGIALFLFVLCYAMWWSDRDDIKQARGDGCDGEDKAG